MAPLKEELGVALAKSIVELERAGIPFALVGGLAVGIRADPRVTRDIDLAIPAESDEQAEATVFALQRRGFIVEAVFVRDGGRISTVRTRHSIAPDVFIDLLSNSRIENEIVNEASLEEVSAGIRCPVAQPWHLVAMKVLANRRKDQPDLQDLIERSDSVALGRARKALQLMQRRGAAPKRDLLAELGRLIQAVRATSRFEKAAPRAKLQRILARNPARR